MLHFSVLHEIESSQILSLSNIVKYLSRPQHVWDAAFWQFQNTGKFMEVGSLHIANCGRICIQEILEMSLDFKKSSLIIIENNQLQIERKLHIGKI
jgi:hypothetical protein